MQKPRKIENVKWKNHTRARKMLLHGIDNFVWASGREREEVYGSREKFSQREGSADRVMKILRARISAELGKVDSSFAT